MSWYMRAMAGMFGERSSAGRGRGRGPSAASGPGPGLLSPPGGPVAARGALPAEVARQPGLAPRGRGAAPRVERLGTARADVSEPGRQLRQVIEDDAVLDADVRLGDLVEGVAVVAVD